MNKFNNLLCIIYLSDPETNDEIVSLYDSEVLHTVCSTIYNEDHLKFFNVLGDSGLNNIIEKTGSECIKLLESSIYKLNDDFSGDGFVKEGDVKLILEDLLYFAQSKPYCIFKRMVIDNALKDFLVKVKNRYKDYKYISINPDNQINVHMYIPKFTKEFINDGGYVCDESDDHIGYTEFFPNINFNIFKYINIDDFISNFATIHQTN